MFLFPNTAISERAEGGGGLVIKNHLKLLRFYSDDIHLVLVRHEKEEDNFDLYFSNNASEYEEIKLLYKTKCSTNLYAAEPRSRLANYFYLLSKPTEYGIPFLNKKSRDEILQITSQLKPDLIWAEHSTAALLCYFSFPADLKSVIYAHHDWEYKLRAFRSNKANKLSYSIRTAIIRSMEINLVRRTGAVVCSSWSEHQDCVKFSATRSVYLPIFADNAYSRSKDRNAECNYFRIFHLGGMKTTANRVGLEKFFETCWPILKSKIPRIKLTLIGSMSGASSKIIRFLDDPSVQVLGYVEDVDSVMDPYCVHIIPWDQNTGVRTKVPIALRNRQVVVGMRNALLCYRELNVSVNVMFADDFDELINNIVFLSENPETLRRLGDNAFESFKQNFVIEAQRENFLNFMKEMA